MTKTPRRSVSIPTQGAARPLRRARVRPAWPGPGAFARPYPYPLPCPAGGDARDGAAPPSPVVARGGRAAVLVRGLRRADRAALGAGALRAPPLGRSPGPSAATEDRRPRPD